MTDEQRTVEFVDMPMADEFARIIQLRQDRFGEPLDVSVKVVLFNFGDERRIAHCVGGDWSGPKSDLAVSDSGLPLCPKCRRPCTEEGRGWRLALVNELPGEGVWGE